MTKDVIVCVCVHAWSGGQRIREAETTEIETEILLYPTKNKIMNLNL